ncbi:hypothetical protein [Caudoviricetes sp.]|nr:hypothetical protein [Caudoviricetes sp.]
MTIGDSLKEILIKQGITARECAKKGTFSTEWLYKVLSNQITNVGLDKIQELSKILDIPVHDFVKMADGDNKLVAKYAITPEARGYIKPDKEFRECYEIWNRLTSEQKKIVITIAKSYLKK